MWGFFSDHFFSTFWLSSAKAALWIWVRLGKNWGFCKGLKMFIFFCRKVSQCFSLRSIWTPSFVDINHERNKTFICPVHGAKLRGAKACPQLRLYCNHCSCYSGLKTSFSCFSFPPIAFESSSCQWSAAWDIFGAWTWWVCLSQLSSLPVRTTSRMGFLLLLVAL